MKLGSRHVMLTHWDHIEEPRARAASMGLRKVHGTPKVGGNIYIYIYIYIYNTHKRIVGVINGGVLTRGMDCKRCV